MRTNVSTGCLTDTVSQLKHLRMQRFKPKFDDEENKRLDLQIDILVTDLTIVSQMAFSNR